MIFDYRYVYVIRIRIGNEDLDKIGIAKSAKSRRKDIEAEIKSKVRRNVSVKVRICSRVFFAERVEAILHRQYKRKHSYPSIRFSGFSECFELNIGDVWFIWLKLKFIRFFQVLFGGFLLLFVAAGLIYALGGSISP